ncbi:MAG: HlyD family efflux transporter periplasmic adaptor subunit [Candidatus Cyclonatronum sp.]|uniref:HlyD family secretion protein n=1 Tax=Cyclonatronum sp. TaxID=3024185 RepID=UPI0025BDA17A|nr:HlyD family efflux transporter periplasmic adaptor subunit [Cyclonatronum sp.]MCH8487905.1 HlyD family efflux transporter periplasmic adaptor subunit [Cyclonatronum sp.]
MSSFDKAPVPIPLKLRFREFRIRLLPLLMFLLAGTAVYILWESRVQTPDFSGRAVGDVVTVLAPADGYLTDISAGPFAPVEQGQRLFTLNRSLPGELESRLAFSEAAIQELRISLSPLSDLRRSYVDYQSLRLDLLELERERAVNLAELAYLRAEESRSRRLLEQQLLEQSAYERVLGELQAREANVEAIGSTLTDLSRQLEALSGSISYREEDATAIMEAAIAVHEAEMAMIEAELGPAVMQAPAGGIVRMQSMYNGQFVTRGDTLAVIESPEPLYIEGYLRQPVALQPETGMVVEIRSRGVKSVRYRASISAVGGAIVPIARDMQRPGMTFESGLPLQIALPPEIRDQFTPGEIVDVRLIGK